jgi:hypothetical protein
VTEEDEAARLAVRAAGWLLLDVTVHTLWITTG